MATKKKLTAVRLRAYFQGVNTGEIAGYDDETVKYLLEKGLAEPIAPVETAPATKPAPVPVPAPVHTGPADKLEPHQLVGAGAEEPVDPKKNRRK